nr:hypothetical protein [Fusobacterium gastrosuis]
MRYSITLNNQKCLEWQLNANQGILVALLNEASSWAKEEIINNNVYYFVSRNLILKELPMYFEKADTVYRNLRILAEKGIIEYIKHRGMDLIRLTEKGKTWNFLDTESENQNSEKNPSKFGKKSENNSEKNPTNKDTNIQKDINKNIKEKINKKEKTLYIAFNENERIKKENEAKELIKNSKFSEEAKEKIIYWWFFVKPKAIKKKLAGNISLTRLLERDYIFNSPYLSEFIQLAEERLWQDLLPTCWDNFIKNKQINEKLKSKSEEKRINHQTTGAVKIKPDSWWEDL